MDNFTKLIDGVYLRFLDFSKAFDVVDHLVVCAKLNPWENIQKSSDG